MATASCKFYLETSSHTAVLPLSASPSQLFAHSLHTLQSLSRPLESQVRAPAPLWLQPRARQPAGAVRLHPQPLCRAPLVPFDHRAPRMEALGVHLAVRRQAVEEQRIPLPRPRCHPSLRALRVRRIARMLRSTHAGAVISSSRSCSMHAGWRALARGMSEGWSSRSASAGRTGLSALSGNTVSPPLSTSDRYMSIVAMRCPPFRVFTLSWK